MTPKQEAWAIQAEHVIKQMERRHFNAYYCSTKEEALTKALSIIEKGSVIASGGSATLGEVGLLDYIKNHSEDYTFIDRSIAKTEDEKRQIHAKAILSDYYLMSTNAFTIDGQLVNIDGNGNRVLDLLIHAARQASAENVCLHPQSVTFSLQQECHVILIEFMLSW